MGGLRNWVGVCAGITVRADCANKRRIYKLVWEVCETGWVCAGITVRADCANKRGIYKLVWEVCETGWVCVRGLRCAQIAQIRGGFINGSGLFAKLGG